MRVAWHSHWSPEKPAGCSREHMEHMGAGPRRLLSRACADLSEGLFWGDGHCNFHPRLLLCGVGPLLLSCLPPGLVGGLSQRQVTSQGRAPSLVVTQSAVRADYPEPFWLPGRCFLQTLVLGSQLRGLLRAHMGAHCPSKSPVYFLWYLCDSEQTL